MRTALAVLLVALSAFLLFWRLDSIPLWRDEATTANWGRLMAESDVWLPRAFDGDQLIVQGEDGHDINSHLLPAMHSWLQFYVAGAGFQLFGVSTWTARLPFALIGAATLFVFYRIGVALFGNSVQALVLPYLGLLSIHFLAAARQCRYYVIVIFAASLLMLEIIHYLRNPERAARVSFFVRIGLYGVLIYLGNYVSFAGTWAALGVFALLESDRRLLRGFVPLSFILVIGLGLEFWFLHSEFAENWPPPESRSTLDLYAGTLIGRGSDMWRMVPLVLLVPAGLFLFSRRVQSSPPLLTAGLICSSLIVLSPFVFDGGDVAQLPRAAFWVYALVCLTAPAAFYWAWRRLPMGGVWARAAVLAGLILLLSPLIAIAAGKNRAYARHFYQTLPAGLLLSALAAAQMEKAAGRSAAGALVAGMLVWPVLDWNHSGAEQMLERQFEADNSYSGPLIDFFDENIRPGDRVAFYRNVKGMAAYFYHPEMRWVALLDVGVPYNRRFRGLIPDDQFDDYRGVDWYVVWDPRGGGTPRHLDERYEKVWEYSYPDRSSWWDSDRTPYVRTYEIYRRSGLR
jgi:4-amino-4-deoxy-L-arabinose transferase-like glycosyltransferase